MLSLILVTLPLGGCLTASPEIAQRIVVRCGSVAQVSKAQQQQAAKELRALPPGSVVAEVIVPDWLRQRDEARACAGQILSLQ